MKLVKLFAESVNIDIDYLLLTELKYVRVHLLSTLRINSTAARRSVLFRTTIDFLV
jgi:hypothetical protein